ncbi:zf-HC2 domain-containing protein [Lentzea sp. BCCO 10_0856]|uniref:Zf-HC2 domain-containing protein n=1 Tax=Lentzea miocenica TaxID=3095431 RepID=A0ABU4T3J5_9PSEU|nr:zf-HC2 domain-containing protein [Lentzea sp. BCCO 10_0856]MDX8032713.1 zf-HC2 domain-containing protein [Lentzea sp. BCCO 10_0856]
MTPPTDPFREWDVAYVLGSLSPSDRQAYEHHLTVCPSCEHEVCQLAGMAGLLSRVPEAWAVESLAAVPDVPATVLPRLARAARLARRRALVVAVLVAGAIGALLSSAACWWP